jgi:hypothetical protein
MPGALFHDGGKSFIAIFAAALMQHGRIGRGEANSGKQLGIFEF